MSLLIPINPLIVDYLKKYLKTSFYVSTILNNKPERENKKTGTCKHFSKKDFHVFS